MPDPARRAVYYSFNPGRGVTVSLPHVPTTLVDLDPEDLYRLSAALLRAADDCYTPVGRAPRPASGCIAL